MATDRANRASGRTQNTLAPATTAADVLVLSADPTFAHAVRKAVDGVRIWHAADATQAADLLVGTHCGVLLLDAGAEGPLATVLAARLAEQFPEMALIAVGSRDDEAALSRLISSGKVYRFLHTPLSHERVRNFVEAGLRRHQTTRSAAISLADSTRNRMPWPWARFAGLAAALVVLAGGGWWWIERPAPAVVHEPAAARTPAPMAVLPAAPTAPITPRAVAPPVRRIERPPLQPAPASEPTATPTVTVMPASSPPGRTAFEQRRLEQRLTGLMTQAQQRLEDDLLIAPAGDSARDKLLAARELDPAFPAMRAGLATLRDRLLQKARKATLQGQFVEAERWLDAVGELQAADPELTAARSLLAAVRLRAATDIQAGRAQERISQGRLLDPPGDSARQYLDAIRRLDPGHAELPALERQFLDRLLDEAARGVRAGDSAAAERYLAAAEGAGASAAQLRPLREELRAQQQRAAFLANVIPESRLQRRHYAAPAYPAAARTQGVEGWVELTYTVTASGTTSDPEIQGSSPNGVFEEAVRVAIRDWRYEPPLVNGVPAAQRVRLRLRFALDR